jgi:hypothetical protein
MQKEASMQLTDTLVGNTDGMITVEFQGEGGELVSVRMAGGDVERDAAISRAKAVMVQITTFAEDRDPSLDDWSHSSDESEEQGGSAVETKPDLPVASSFSNSPSSVGSTA